MSKKFINMFHIPSNCLSSLQHENEELRRAVEGLAISVQILQKENEENELQRERDYENRGKVKFTDNDNDNFVTAPNTPSICDPLSDERRRKELSEEVQSGCSQECSPEDSEIQNGPTSLVHCLNDDLIEGIEDSKNCTTSFSTSHHIACFMHTYFARRNLLALFSFFSNQLASFKVLLFYLSIHLFLF